MSTSEPTNDAGPIFRLDRKLDTTQAAPLAAALRAVRGTDLILDASDVEHLGAQCVQVLLSAQRTWQAEAHEFRITQRSSAFDEGIRLLGLAAALEN